jgi:hydroxyacylglutathione hydrolase
MFLERKPLGVYGANCYIIACEKTKDAAIIDPGGEGEEVVKIVEENDLIPSYIILTHGHGDHIAAAVELSQKYDIEILIHKDDIELLLNPDKNLSSMMPISPLTIEKFKEVLDGDKIMLGEIELEVIHTPGHTRGSICLKAENKLFTGDTLFKSSIGRTDLYGGNDDIVSSIKSKLLSLDPETIVLPGHGAVTILKEEIATNPFIMDRI